MSTEESKKLALKAKVASDTPPTAEDVARTKALIEKQAAEKIQIEETGTAIVKTKKANVPKPTEEPLIELVMEPTPVPAKTMEVRIAELEEEVARLSQFMGSILRMAAMLGASIGVDVIVDYDPPSKLIPAGQPFGGQPVVEEKARKPRKIKIYTDEEKVAVRARLLAGQLAAKAKRAAELKLKIK